MCRLLRESIRSFWRAVWVGRPPGVRAGTPIPVPFAFNSGPQPIPAGGHYEWRLMIDGETDEDWRLAFSTWPETQSYAA